jgi:opacity protein-like surface antigen
MRQHPRRLIRKRSTRWIEPRPSFLWHSLRTDPSCARARNSKLVRFSTANASRGAFQQNTGLGFVSYDSYANTSLYWLGTVRGRFGVLATPSLLIYATGGWAYGGVSHSFGGQFGRGAPAHHYGRRSTEASGWTYGGGLEYLISPRITDGAEYLFVDLDTADT